MLLHVENVPDVILYAVFNLTDLFLEIPYKTDVHKLL